MDIRSDSALNRLTMYHVVRVELGYNNSFLARKFNISRSTIVGIDKGRILPNLSLAYEISKLFGHSIEELFFMEV